MMSFKGFEKNVWAHLVLLVLVCSLVYVNIFSNDFVFDDKDFIVEWETPRDLSNIPALIAGETAHPGSYRPITSLYYAFTYAIWGSTTTGYHVHSVVMHVIAVLLVYWIVFQLSSVPLLSLFVPLLFGLHPIHTEVVTFMTSTYDLAALFLLMSVGCYLYSLAKKQLRPRLWYGLSVLFAVLAYFTYEMTLIIVLLLISHDVLFKKWKWVKKQILYYLPYMVFAALYLFIRSRIPYEITRGGYVGESMYLTALASIKALWKYMALHVIPYPLSVNHVLSEGIFSYRRDILLESAQSQSLFEPLVVLSLFVILGLLYFAWYVRSNHPLVSFGIVWFFIALLPALNIIPQAALFAERYAYIATFGFALLLGYGLYLLYEHFSTKKMVVLGVVVVISLSYGAIAIDRNTHWKNSTSLWSETVKHSPQSSLALNNLGLAYEEQGEYQRAINAYEEVLAYNPSYVKTHNNLGSLLLNAGLTALAIEHYEQAVALDPSYTQAYHNLGAAQYRQGNLVEAEQYMHVALSLDEEYASAYNTLGLIKKALGDVQGAKVAFEQALVLESGFEEARGNLATMEIE